MLNIIVEVHQNTKIAGEVETKLHPAGRSGILRYHTEHIMTTAPFPFQTIDWKNVPETVHRGDVGTARWKSVEWDGLRLRIVTYSPGYIADHWCTKGHVVFCLSGSFVSELNDGRTVELHEGMSYVVSDDMSAHRSRTDGGVTLFIMDGHFLRKE